MSSLRIGVNTHHDVVEVAAVCPAQRNAIEIVGQDVEHSDFSELLQQKFS
jgi:hypothetical protein